MYIERRILILVVAVVALIGAVLFVGLARNNSSDGSSSGGTGGGGSDGELHVAGSIIIIMLPVIGGGTPTTCEEMGENFEITVSDGTGARLKLLELTDPKQTTSGSPPSCDFKFAGDISSDSDVFDVTAGPSSNSLYSNIAPSKQTVSRDKLGSVPMTLTPF
ncbi:hypothetical protein [Kineosporia succinea]|uniref:Uncharacterized protein n=1 Tax=Kineosporia succinea TaxID=84632 RepID=A0ABT9NYP5_9ACTN|nr:hypothetical protein [Kineosporia succinea]MDP9825254.1 hypothetical protein [Kineosporia succinea]